MTDRGAGSDVARVCPFVALADDRDRRLEQPDHRHRCFAESPPAPRAIAHQEAFCLSPSFPGCPVFQDWARREAASPAARGSVPIAAPSGARPDEASRAAAGPRPDDAIVAAGAAAAASAAATPPAVPTPPPSDDVPPGPWDGWTSEPDDRSFDAGAVPPRRRHARDWAAPPPWAGEERRAAARGAAPPPPGAVPPDGDELPPFLADRRPSDASERGDDEWPDRDARSRLDREDDARGGGARPRRPDELDAADEPDDDAYEASGEVRSRGRSIAAGRYRDAERSGPPPWERPRRSEDYPTLKRPMDLPRLGPLAVALIALIAAALVLFFVVPSLLLGGPSGGIGGGGASTPRPSIVASAAPSASPTPAAPTPQVYIVHTGDTLSKIAKKFGVTVDEIIAANPQIKNPDRIALGAQLVIPVPGASVPEPSASG